MEKDRATGKYLLPAAVILSLAGFLILTICLPPVFALNDDVQLLSILSGDYTGTPDLHTVYMRAPLSFLISSLYRVAPGIPWFGAFYLFVYIGGYLWMLVTFLKSSSGSRQVSGSVLHFIIFLWICVSFVVLPYVRPHYTTLAAFAGGVGIFLIAAGGMERKQKIAAVVFLLLADQIRSQVFYLLCPFAAAALVYRCIAGDGIGVLRKEPARIKCGAKYPVVFLVLFLLLFGTDAFAYRTPEWKEFLALNRARTQLYDYTGVWETETAAEYYGTLGVPEAALPLYVNYDILPDPQADAARLSAMAAYTEPTRAVSGMQHLKNVLYELRVRIFGVSGGDAPYNFAFLLLFLLAFLPEIISALREKKDAGKRRVRLVRAVLSAAVFAGFFAVYGWLIWRGRVPERVTVSLYNAVIFLYFGILLREDAPEMPENRVFRAALPVCAAVLTGIALHGQLRREDESYRQQIAVNMDDNVLYLYTASHPDDLFLLETYATVYRTQRVLENCPAGTRNTMLLGGWQYGSPLQLQKLSVYGFGDTKAPFLEGGALFVRRPELGLTAEELQEFLNESRSGDRVKLEPYTVPEEVGGRFEIYRLLLLPSAVPEDGGC